MMKNIDIKYLMLFSFAFTAYLLFGTGMSADEFWLIDEKVSLFSPELFIASPASHYNYLLPIYLTGLDRPWLLDVLKILYINMFIYMLYKYISLFHTERFSYLLSFFLVMSFVHDGTSFWFLGGYIIFTFAFLAYAYYLLEHGYIRSGVLVALLGSFTAYSSPIFALSLSVGFLINKELKKFIIYITPNVIYVIYYLAITEFLGMGIERVHTEKLNIFKQFFLQIITYVDTVTVALVVKAYYLLADLSVWYYLASLLILAAIVRVVDLNEHRDKTLSLVLIAMMLVGFIVLSLTGGYYQVMFSLGNRINYFATTIFLYLVISSRYNIYLKSLFIYILVVTLFATSVHWKEWNVYQTEKYGQFLENPDVKQLSGETVYIYGRDRSHFGGIDHLALPFEFNISCNCDIYELNRSFFYQDDYLVKHDGSVKIQIDDFVYVYFLKDNALKKIPKEDISQLIESSDHHYRHWAQTLNQDNYIKKIIYQFMPSLNYEK